jgi:adenosine deaminase
MGTYSIAGLALFAVLVLPAAQANAQGGAQAKAGGRAAAEPAAVGEQRAVRAFEAAKAGKASALTLEAFLEKMPKGADLHMHLTGAVYAETLIKDAAAEKLCVNMATRTLVANVGLAKGAGARPTCADGAVPVADAFGDRGMYDALVDAWSMRSFVASAGVSGHDQFFATFDRDDPNAVMDARHEGEWLDEVATRAVRQNEQYLEVMHTPSTAVGATIRLGNQFGWPATAAGAAVDPEGDATGTSKAELGALRTALLAGGLRDEVEREAKELDDALAERDRIEHCGQPNAAAGCGVKIRWLYQVLREFPPQVVFAQALMGFEIANADTNVVGENFVRPEDAYLPMSEYNRQMHMLDYLHGEYPRVHVSLHAGELAPGLVPPEGLTFHIREAIDVGHAERIGHGVDVMYETDPHALLKEMAERHVMVEINLTSNDVILGVTPPRHPLPEYREAHVPVALSTDDEGVSRIDLTHEYVRAAMEYGLGYLDLKGMARTSLEHSFLPGESLWDRPDDFTKVKAACAGQAAGTRLPTGDCMALLKRSQRAAEQWELEHRFAVFEASVP